jgi:hypothetical protein
MKNFMLPLRDWKQLILFKLSNFLTWICHPFVHARGGQRLAQHVFLNHSPHFFQRQLCLLLKPEFNSSAKADGSRPWRWSSSLSAHAGLIHITYCTQLSTLTVLMGMSWQPPPPHICFIYQQEELTHFILNCSLLKSTWLHSPLSFYNYNRPVTGNVPDFNNEFAYKLYSCVSKCLPVMHKPPC